jgi:hypothetical protein
MPEAVEYRQRADECIRLARHASNGADREAWLRLAESWLLLVQHSAQTPLDPTEDSEPWDGLDCGRS